MKATSEVTNLEELLERIGDAGNGEKRIFVGSVLDAAGRRSFGPALLIPGLIALSPLSGIPGIPTLVGAMVALTTVQLLLRRRHLWMPRFVLCRSTSKESFERALRTLRPLARFIDGWIRPRLIVLTEGVAVTFVAGFCLLLAAMMPIMELLPFAATAIGAAMTSFGLGLIAHDGVLVVLAFAFCIAAAWLLGLVIF